MKNKIITLLIYLLCGVLYPSLYSQNYISTESFGFSFTPKNLGTSSPEITDMVRFGNIPVNKYHGLLDFGVNLDGYKDNDFDISISLSYISNGFVPVKRPSIVGYNWNIQCGGAITRTMNGSPDDTKGRYSNKLDHDYLLDGFLVPIRENQFKIYSEEDLTNFNVDLNKEGKGTYYEYGDFKYDLEPDVFTFAFGKCHGSFIIGNDGTPVLLEENGCKIDISGMAIQSYSTTEAPISSTIIITTPDGYKFTFGGDTNYLEYFIPSNNNIKHMPRYITSWRLSSIVSPNHRIAEFNYTSKMQLNKYRSLAYYYHESCLALNPNEIAVPIKGEASANIVVEDQIYTPLLKDIIIDNVKIQFIYDENLRSFYTDGSLDNLVQLKKINHYVNDELLKEAKFIYKFKNQYFFLESLSEKDLHYQFHYNLNKTLPDPMTLSLDHWGFWKGGYETTIVGGEKGRKEYCKNIYNNREIDEKEPLESIGMLSEIIYPTGGKTVILYESNKYVNYTTRTYDSPYFKESLDQPKYCGGVRVKRLEDYAESGKAIQIRDFHYQDSLGNECGTIGLLPEYEMYEAMVIESYGYRIDEHISANSYGDNNVFSEYHVGYPYVKEVYGSEGSNNNGFIEYKFTSRIDTSNSDDIGMKIMLGNPYLGNYGVAAKYGTLFTNDKSRFRGLLLEEKIYNSSGELVEKIENKYNLEDAENSYHISLRATPRTMGYYKIYLTPCLLMQQKIIDENGIEKKYTNTYTEKSFLRSQETINSDGSASSINYKYPLDFYANTVCQGMISKNIIAPIIEKSVSKNSAFLQKNITNYRLFSNDIYLPYSLQIQSNLGALETREIYDYDIKGNLRNIITDDNIKTAFIWGYNYQYPVAGIKNVSYSDIETILGASKIQEIGSAKSLSNENLELLNNLRASLPNSEVTTYTYKPLVGMLTKTDPRGVSSYFDYDDYGRLNEVSVDYEEKKETINNYQYYLIPLFEPTIISVKSEFKQGDNSSFSLIIKNGSGNYSYNWQLQKEENNINKILIKGTNSIFPVKFTDTGEFIVTCNITDHETGRSVMVSKNILVK